MTLSAADVTAEPSQLAASVETPDAVGFRVRLLAADDAEPLGVFFDALTPATRGVYGPHPLHSEHAAILCEQIDYDTCLRFIATGPSLSEQIAGYMILELRARPGDSERYAEVGRPLDPATTATFAPVISDAWQEHGLGSAMMPVILQAARRLGRQRIVLMGGVRDDNPRARHFYEKFGFQRVRGFFAGGVDNHDMILPL